MSEKKNKGNEILFVLFLIVVCIMGFVIYRLYQTNLEKQLEINFLNEKIKIIENSIVVEENKEDVVQNENNDNEEILKLGKYYKNQYLEDGILDLFVNGRFDLNLMRSCNVSGTYKIEDNKLVCYADLYYWYSGDASGSRECKDILTFEIIDNEEIKLVVIERDVEMNMDLYEDVYKVTDIFTKESSVVGEGLEFGEYYINEVGLDEDGISNEDCSVMLAKGNKFVIYLGWGFWHTGKYEIKDGKLICTSDLLSWESGGFGSENVNVIFYFDIVNDNLLSLTKIDYDKDYDRIELHDNSFEIGFTYSKKNQ